MNKYIFITLYFSLFLASVLGSTTPVDKKGSKVTVTITRTVIAVKTDVPTHYSKGKTLIQKKLPVLDCSLPINKYKLDCLDMDSEYLYFERKEKAEKEIEDTDKDVEEMEEAVEDKKEKVVEEKKKEKEEKVAEEKKKDDKKVKVVKVEKVVKPKSRKIDTKNVRKVEKRVKIRKRDQIILEDEKVKSKEEEEKDLYSTLPIDIAIMILNNSKNILRKIEKQYS